MRACVHECGMCVCMCAGIHRGTDEERDIIKIKWPDIATTINISSISNFYTNNHDNISLINKLTLPFLFLSTLRYVKLLKPHIQRPLPERAMSTCTMVSCMPLEHCAIFTPFILHHVTLPESDGINKQSPSQTHVLNPLP